MKPILNAEKRASFLSNLQISVLATCIMCLLKHQKESTVRGHTLNPDHELPHTVVLLEVCPYTFWFSGRLKIYFLNKVFRYDIVKNGSPQK